MKLAARDAAETDVRALCAAASGRAVRECVRDELRARRNVVRALAETLAPLDERARAAFDRLTLEVHVVAAEREFWEADGGAVARDVCARYAALLSNGGRLVVEPDSRAALKGILLSLAYLVAKNRAVRRLSGIRKRLFRW